MTPKQILLAAGALLLFLIVGLFAALSKSSVRATSGTPVDGEAARLEAATGVLGEADALADPARAQNRSSGRSKPVAQRLPPFAESNGVRLVVVSAEDHTPAPAAEVRTWEQGSEDLTILQLGGDWIGPDFEGFMNANGRAYVTDENGEVDLPRPGRWTFVCARLGERFGWDALEPSQSGLAELKMIRTHSLVARVRDAHGALRSNVRVSFGRCEDGASLWEAPTNAHGEVRIPSVEVLLHEVGLDDPQSAFALRLAIPERTRVEHWLTLDTLPAGPIEFVLPATGSVRVRVVDEARRVVPVSGSLALTAAGETAPGRPHLDEEAGSTTANFTDGIAIVPRVGLGLRFELTADLPGTGDNSLEFTGPTVEGEEVTVELTPASDHTMLAGRLVDEAGRPLAHTTVDWRRMLDDGHSIQASGRDRFVTDGEGRFLWTLRRSSRATGESTHRTGFLCELSNAPLRRQATVHFPLEITSAVTELGDISMTAAPALARGRVVDARDRPVADAEVTLQIKLADGYESADTFDSAFTAADGSFAIFGPCLALELALDVDGPTIKERKHVPFVCSSGSTDLLIRIDSAGCLEGTALIDHDVVLDNVVVTFTLDGESDPHVTVADVRRAGERLFFRFTGETPGVGTVLFYANGTEEPPVAVVPRVVIGETRLTRPPELVDVDLRGKLLKSSAATPLAPAIEFTVVDARGRPIPRGMVWGISADSGDEQQRRIGSGTARIPSEWLQSFASLEFWAPGCRATSLTPPFVSRRIVLDPELEIELRAATPKVWSDAKLEMVGLLELLTTEPPQFAPMALSRMHEFLFDAKGRAAGGLPAGGRFALQLVLRRQGVEGWPDIDYHGLTLTNYEFTVRETDGLQVIDLTLDPEAVARCNEDLGLK